MFESYRKIVKMLVVYLGLLCTVPLCSESASSPTSSAVMPILCRQAKGHDPSQMCVMSSMYLRGGGFFGCFGSQKEKIEEEKGPEVGFIAHYRGNDDLYEPAVVGSGKLLGNWDMAKAVRMTDSGAGRYTLSIRFPNATSQYEFKYVLLPKISTKDLQPIWEEGANRAVSVTDRGQAEFSSGALPHHLNSNKNTAPPLIEVTFNAHYNLKDPWTVIAVVGGCGELGMWNVSGAVTMTPGDKNKADLIVWQATVPMEMSSQCDFKFVLMDTFENPKKLAWEGGHNRVVTLNNLGHVAFHPDAAALQIDMNCPHASMKEASAASAKGSNPFQKIGKSVSFLLGCK